MPACWHTHSDACVYCVNGLAEILEHNTGAHTHTHTHINSHTTHTTHVANIALANNDDDSAHAFYSNEQLKQPLFYSHAPGPFVFLCIICPLTTVFSSNWFSVHISYLLSSFFKPHSLSYHLLYVLFAVTLVSSFQLILSYINMHPCSLTHLNVHAHVESKWTCTTSVHSTEQLIANSSAHHIHSTLAHTHTHTHTIRHTVICNRNSRIHL